MIESAYKNRNTHYKKEKNEIVELTSETNGAIDLIILYKGTQVYLIFYVATSIRVLVWLKVKASRKEKLNKNSIFAADLSEFVNLPARILRRIISDADSQTISLRRNRDKNVTNKEEKQGRKININKLLL